MSNSEMSADRLPTFADVLAIPQLVVACGAALDAHWARYERSIETVISGKSSPGVKMLREVSKEISLTMLSHVTRFTLYLEDPEKQGNIEAFKFLSGTQLSKFCVKVGQGKGFKKRKVPAPNLKFSEGGFLALQEQFEAFMCGIGSALNTVTILEVTAHIQVHKEGDQEETRIFLSGSNILSKLASACPALRNLTVYGLIFANALQAVAESCPCLTHLSFEPCNQHLAFVQQLPHLLPNVASLTFHTTSSYTTEEHQRHVTNAVLCLADCLSITYLNLGPKGLMTEEMWTTLPASLTDLVCAKSHRMRDKSEGPYDCFLPNLKQVTCNCGIDDAADLLMAAPNLNIWNCDLIVNGDLELVPSWDLICKRVKEGLSGPKFVCLGMHEDGETLAFLSKVQPMLGVTTVYLTYFETNHNQNLEGDSDCLQHLARVFPDTTTLSLSGPKISDCSLYDLIPLCYLRILRFDGCENLHGDGIAMMVSCLRSMDEVTFTKCANITGESIGRLKDLFARYNHGVLCMEV